MIDAVTIQGRQIGPLELEQVRGLIAAHAEWSRYKLSRQLAELWDWRNPAGQLKDMAARTLLLKLEQRGWIKLPACRWASPNRMRHKAKPSLDVAAPLAPIVGALSGLLPLSIGEVSHKSQRADRALFDALLCQHHYLSHCSTVGENLQYLVRDGSGRPLACVLFGAAAWQCRTRDEYIGWDATTRQRRLSFITNNTRFLIVPWARVPHLASHVLGFVDTSRFQGACYRAANWQAAGQTTGRTRQNKTMVAQAPPKAVWLYPLREDFREALCLP